MRLGYAITVHKSQGQTLDAMNLRPEIWDNGQLYVALSRCRSIENIYIDGVILPRSVKASEEVLKFYHNPEGYSFFGNENNRVHISVPAKYVPAIEALIEKWQSEEEEEDEWAL